MSEQQRDRLAELRDRFPELRLLTLKQVEEVTGLSYVAVRQLVERRVIGSVRSGEDYRVPVRAILHFYDDVAEGRSDGTEATGRPTPLRRRKGA